MAWKFLFSVATVGLVVSLPPPLAGASGCAAAAVAEAAKVLPVDVTVLLPELPMLPVLLLPAIPAPAPLRPPPIEVVVAAADAATVERAEAAFRAAWTAGGTSAFDLPAYAT